MFHNAEDLVYVITTGYVGATKANDFGLQNAMLS